MAVTQSYWSTIAGVRARVSLRLWLTSYRSYKRIYHPFVDLGIRLAIAQTYLASGLVKAANWHNAVYLARYEYPIDWLSPEHAAALGIVTEIICPILLALGLFTRAAALAMASLAILVQTQYQQLDTNLLWTVLLLRCVVFGPRELSIDRLVAPGLADGALPLVRIAMRIARTTTRTLGPAYLLALRWWLAWTLLHLPAPHAWFPVEIVGQAIPNPVAAIGAAMLALGLGTSIANKALAAAAIGMRMMTGGGDGGMWLILVLAQVGMVGAGRWSLDDPVTRVIEAWIKPRQRSDGAGGWPRVVIVGAGFGGMACAMKLRHLPVRLTIIDRNNHHLFQPLLYQVATAGLDPGAIATPIRSQFRDDPDVRVVMATVTGVDTGAKCVLMAERSIAYDMLVLATGASHGYFGNDAWARVAPGLKRIEDATLVRAKLLLAFERAENAADAVERRALLTFVVVGAGPTGVELAGAIAELARFGLDQEFRGIDPAEAHIVLVQSGPRILPALPSSLALQAAASLTALGVEVRVNSRVVDIDDGGVRIGDDRIAAGTVLWAAGVVASPAARWIDLGGDKRGRVPVGANLGATGHADIFAIGDTAASDAWAGKPVPGLAAAARQGGKHVARVIRARLEQHAAPSPFVYRHLGSMATIGRKAAVADLGRLRLWGAPAWWLWGAVHVMSLTGMRSRLSVVIAWGWAYVTLRSGTRLITGVDAPSQAP